jgi:hypothetical protein
MFQAWWLIGSMNTNIEWQCFLIWEKILSPPCMMYKKTLFSGGNYGNPEMFPTAMESIRHPCPCQARQDKRKVESGRHSIVTNGKTFKTLPLQ